MLKCPFCGYDYSEHGLRDGRCAGCGSVLAWEGGSGDVPEAVRQAIFAQTMQSIRPGIRPTPVPVVTPTPPAASRPAAGATSPPSAAADDAATSAAADPPTASDAETESPSSPEAAVPSAPGSTGSGSVPARLLDRPPEISSEILRTLTPAALSSDEVRDVSEAWQEAADADDVRPGSTLKGRSSGKVTDTALVIQTRSVVNKREAGTLPIEAEYELLDVIGQGGVGVVYLARQSSIDRDVAVKMLRKDRVEDPTNRDKFLAEAVVTGDLDHPNIVPIYDLGTDSSGALFYSMKRVQGTPWSEVLSRRSLSQNLDILLKVADAIAFAHARGIVHRDIKPENVMLGDFGEVLVMDWGIALPLESYGKSSGFLRTQGLGGSPAYMAPEMVTGPVAKIGPASDIYLLGASLFEVLTGRPPHAGRSVMECLMAAARNDIVATQATGELLEIALRALATRPADRYRSVLAFQSAIRDYESHAESIALSTRAADDLAQARSSRSYDDFSRASFACQEALALWGGNKAARVTWNEVKLAYAATALDKGDYDLGLSLLDPSDSRHDDLRARLVEAAADRDARQSRLRYVKRLVAALLILIFVGGALALWTIWHALGAAQIAESNAKDAATKAKKSADEAKTQKLAADEARERAVESQDEERVAKEQAILSQRDALVQKRLAEDARQQVEESSYVHLIGFAAAKIKANAFDVAREILGGVPLDSSPGQPAATATAIESHQARYRHWEWGRLQFLCRQGAAGNGAERAVLAYRTSWPVTAFALSPDDRTLALGSRSGALELRSHDNRLLTQLTVPAAARAASGPATEIDGVSALAFSPDGRWLARGSTTGSVHVWERVGEAEWRLAGRFDHAAARTGKREVRQLAFSYQEPWSLLTVVDRVVYRWDRDTSTAAGWKAAIGYHGHLDRVWHAVFSHDGKLIVSGSEDGTVRLWDRASGAERAQLSAHEGPVYAVEFAPDDQWCVSTGFDQRVLAWDLAAVSQGRRTEELVFRTIEAFREGQAAEENFVALSGHSGSIRTAAFSRNGQVLVTAGQDNTALVWDASAIRRALADRHVVPPGPQKILRSHGSWIQQATVTGDGARVFTSSNDGTWRQWNVAAYAEVMTLQDGDRHGVTAARFAPGGQTVVTGHDNGVAQLWDATTGRSLGEFREGHEFLTMQGQFLPDGQHALTVAGDGTIRVWDLVRRVEAYRLQGTGRRAIAAVSADGTRVLTAGPYGTARWWDVAQGRLLATLAPPRTARVDAAPPTGTAAVFPVSTTQTEVTAVAVDRTGQYLLTGDAAGRCWLWDAEQLQPTLLPGTHRSAVAALFFLPPPAAGATAAGRAISLSVDGQLKLWGTDQRAETVEIAETIDAAGLSDDGAYLVLAGSAGERRTGMWWWSVAEKKVVARAELADQSVNSLEFLPGKAYRVLVSTTALSSSRQELREWSLAQAAAGPTPYVIGAGRTPWGGLVWHADESVDGRQLLTVSENSASLWDRASGGLLANLRVHTSITALDISPDGRLLATAGAEGVIKLWSTETRQPLRRLAGLPQAGQRTTWLEFSPDNRWLVAATGSVVQLWDVERGELIGQSPDGQPALVMEPGTQFALARFAPDGRHLLTAGSGAAPRLWKLVAAEAAGRWQVERVHTLTPGDAANSEALAIRAAAFSPDGRWIVTGGEDRLVRFWSRAAGRQIAVRSSHSEPVGTVEFSPDGLRAMTGSDDGRALLWDTRVLDELYERSQEGAMENTAYNSDRSPEILTLSRYGDTARDSQGQAIERTHEGQVTAVAFSPRGDQVLTAGAEGAAFLWPAIRVAPSISLSSGSMTLPGAEQARQVDPRAIVTHLGVELQQPVQLTVRLTAGEGMGGPALDSFRLELIPGELPSGACAVRDGSIYYRAGENGPERVVGRLQGGTGGQPLVVELTAGTPGAVFTAVVRGVALTQTKAQGTLAAAGNAGLVVEFRLRQGEDQEHRGEQVERRTVELTGESTASTPPRGGRDG